MISDLAELGKEDELQKVAPTTEDVRGIACNTVKRNINKAHPIGEEDENGKQRE